MARQIFIGLISEGSTDQRFLKSIVERTFDDLKFECDSDIDIFDIKEIKLSTGTTFVTKVLESSSIGYKNFGMTILCVQTDADNRNLEDTYSHKIKPALIELESQDANQCCKILVAIVPIQETEAWMLADKELLKQEMGTDRSDNDLEINRMPEHIANPKEVIENAIRIARESYTKKRRKDLTLADLYLPIGQSIDLFKLERLSSYQDFQSNVRKAFKSLNLLH